jgi:PAS domain S-box-containing protein
LNDLDQIALPACLGEPDNPFRETNALFDKAFGTIGEDGLRVLQTRIGQAAEGKEKYFEAAGAERSRIQVLPATAGRILVVFQPYTDEYSNGASAHPHGYRIDSDIPGFTINEAYEPLTMNEAGRKLLASMPGRQDSISIAELIPAQVVRSVKNLQQAISFSFLIDYRRLEIRVRPSLNSSEYIVRIQDVTHFAENTRLVRHFLNPYENILKNLKIGFYQTTATGRFLIVNEELVRILGYDSTEHFRNEINDAAKLYVDPTRRSQLLEKLKDAGQIVDAETELYRRDGSVAKVTGTIVAVKNRSGEIEYIQGTLLDISAGTRQNRMMKLLRNTLYDVNDSINIADMDDRIIFVNKAFTKMYGWGEEEVIGKRSSIFWSGKFAGTGQPDIKKVTLENGGYRAEVKNRTKDGRELVVSLSTSVIRDELDNPLAFIAIARDVTREREFEQKLLEAKLKAEETSQLKSVILSNMSHELRTPLTGIIGFASILLEQLSETEDSDTLYFLDNIKKAGERLLQTMNNILLLAELESRKVEYKISETNVNALLEQSRAHFREQAEKSGIRLVVDCEPGLIVQTDKNLMLQVLNTMVDNGIKFTEEGQVTLIGRKLKDGRVLMGVKDTGIGINPAEVSKIFEPFTQLSAGIKRKYQGTGLGLHLCRRYVDLLEVELEVESETGKGAFFKLIMPHTADTEVPVAEVQERLESE